MELKKLAPWNWFKGEEEAHSVPVRHNSRGGERPPGHPYEPMVQVHREIDRLFENFFRGFPLSTIDPLRPFAGLGESGLLRPKADLSATDKEYRLTVEIPGVSEKDVSLAISDNSLTIRGEKKQEKEEKEKDFYRIERSYGSFQRVLSLPGDVDQDGISAGFKDGVLTVTMPRKEVAGADVKTIEITAMP